ncbi:hypothetical protein [Streptomyces sp. NPDC050759]|uniref:hypothetical protein n=1 Tax=Streptomyces sp. NPDC050759 TaxID=3365635 RepID=UPI0037A21A0E
MAARTSATWWPFPTRTGTCRRAYFVGGLKAEQGERQARLELRAVGELYTSSDPVTVTHPW